MHHHKFIQDTDHPILIPGQSPWADTMVLNPAIVRLPGSDRIHMLFRATGPCSYLYRVGRVDPYPIFLGYAWSDDDGQTWQADFSRPALAPQLANEPDDLWITNANGERVINYANGCIEDPRLTLIDDKLYLTAACRMFPPGPYWENDEPLQCTPSWALTAHETFGDAATQNITVNVLFEVDPQKLAEQDYDHCFSYVGPLTDPSRGDNRDAFLFPEKLKINGQSMYVCVHRPRDPWHYPGGKPGQSPAIYLAAAQTLEDLPSDRALHIPLAQGLLEWEGNRVGGSFPPIRIASNQWLLPYHGKQNDKIGYTQSFMILEQDQDGWPRLKHRCPDRLLYATQDWQHSDRFTIPCIFTCGGVITKDQQLLMSYGAADEVIGTAKAYLNALVKHIQRFDQYGQSITMCNTLSKVILNKLKDII